MILGCGNSALGRQLFDAGYRDVTNSDYSEVCIDKQEAWHRTDGYKDIKWEVIDMTSMAHIKVTSINTCQTKIGTSTPGSVFFALDSYSDII